MTDTIYSATQVSRELGVSQRRIQQIAKILNVGRAPTGHLLFSEADLDAMREYMATDHRHTWRQEREAAQAQG